MRRRRGAGERGQDVFTYTLTDGDGEIATATLTIAVPGNPDTVPEVLRAEDAIVDEDGLPGANTDADPLQTDPDETDFDRERDGHRIHPGRFQG